MYESMTEVARAIVDGMHTSIPAVVERYDESGGTVSVTPTVAMRMRNGVVVEMPRLDGVPVVFPQTSMFDMRFPISKGDTVLLLFSEADLSQWKAGNGKSRSKATTFSRFQLGDAVAIPGLAPKPVKGKCRMVLHDDGTLEYRARKITFNCPVVANENLIVRKDVFVGATDAMGVSVMNHTHTTYMGPTVATVQLPNTDPEAAIPPIIGGQQ